MIETAWAEWVARMQPDDRGWWDLGDGHGPADWFEGLALEAKAALSQRRLQAWLYRHLVSGVATMVDDDREMAIAQRRIDGLDLEFAGGLHRENQGTGYWDADWRVEQVLADGQWAMSKQDLTIDVWPEKHLEPGVSPMVGQTVRVKLPKNLVMADRYMAVGNAGQPVGERVQLFIHCDRQGVLPIMRQVTQTLNDRGLLFSLAVPYEPLDYPRWDAGSLIIEAQHQATLQTLCQIWALDWVDDLLAGEVQLAQAIGPGLAIAPLAADMVDFGWARCQDLAQVMMAGNDRERMSWQNISELNIALAGMARS
jgi:hypothetical protein